MFLLYALQEILTETAEWIEYNFGPFFPAERLEFVGTLTLRSGWPGWATS